MSKVNSDFVVVNKYRVVTASGSEIMAFSQRGFVDFTSFVINRLKNNQVVSFRKDPHSAATDGDIHAVLIGNTEGIHLMEIVETIRVQV